MGVGHVKRKGEAACNSLDADGRLRVLTEEAEQDRKSTRLNSSHRTISYAVFCLKKKNILIKCGTRTFVEKFVEIMLREYHPKKQCIFSRNEMKQKYMRA